MAAKPTRRKGWELFAHPAQPNQRRYEALRAYLYEGASLGQAAARFGYTPATLESLARDLRAGRLTLFAPVGKPGRKHAPKKDRARVIQLRREGLSVYEISTRLAVEGIGLNRTGVGQILAEEGFGRLLRDPAEQASTSPATSGRDTRLPTTSVLDFGAFPQRVHTAMAGLLLAVPDLVALDLPALVRSAGYPGTKPVPAISYLLSLLALKLTGTRRVSHVDDLLGDPAAACSPACRSCRRRPR
jgi:transposase